MSSSTKADGTGELRLPTVKLDQTLSDLYKKHCPSWSSKQIGHIFCGVTCTSSLSDDFPANRKYIYQDSAFNDPELSSKTEGHVCKQLAPKYLSLVPQRDAFIAGNAPVLFFYSGSSTDERRHDEQEAARTLSVLEDGQRPETVFLPGPGDVAAGMREHGIDAITSKLVLDQVAASEDVRKIVDPDKIWYLNSKEALAVSGLPTSPAKIVDVEGYCPPPSNCCEICEANGADGEIAVPVDCTGPRTRWIGEQSMRVLTAVERHPLPFVFKNQQAFGGAGTYVVTKGTERSRLIHDMTSGGILRRMFSHVTQHSQHLKPGTVLLTEMVKDPTSNVGLTFFVSEAGECVFLGGSEQIIDHGSASWIGSIITYSHQTTVENKYHDLVDEVASYLHKQGYIGTAGIDVLEKQDGQFSIVDMNVRTSGSLCLPLLREHFTCRSFDSASSLSITVSQSRAEFCKEWSAPLQLGQMCILAWYEDDYAKKSFGDVVVAGKNKQKLEEMLRQVRDVSDEVTF